MRIFPIIPIWIMLIVCTLLLIIIIRKNINIIQIIIVTLMFIANLRIMITSNNSQALANNLDVLFVIDSTISMNAEDYDGGKTRLYAVKEDCKYIAKRLNGAKFSLITFNNTAKVVIPYTRDINITMEAIDVIEPIEQLYAKGSSLNTPIEAIVSSLKSSKKKDDRTRIIFFISDGEITDNSSLKDFSEISKYIDNGAVLGYGTANGGYMKNVSNYSKEDNYIMYYENNSYDKALSRIDENNLKAIAKDIKVEYINMEKQNKINDKLREIENSINQNIELSDKSTYVDTYYIFIVFLLALLVIELNKFRRNNIWKKY